MGASKAQIFVVYHTAAPLFESELLHPIQTGAALSAEKLPMLHDDTGEHRSQQNPSWCELTVLYWIWKNALHAAPQCDYWGLCHYRRFMSFTRKPSGQQRKIEIARFQRDFEKHFAHAPTLSSYDLYLPESYDCYPLTVEQDYLAAHPAEGWHLMKQVLIDLQPDYESTMHEVLTGHKVHFALNFVMRRDHFDAAMSWIFSLVEEWQQRVKTLDLESSLPPRLMGFIIERFINIWYCHQQRENQLRVKEVYSCLLIARIPWWRRTLMSLWHHLPLPLTARRALQSRLRHYAVAP